LIVVTTPSNRNIATGCVNETEAVRHNSHSEACKKIQHDRVLIT
jgi:hypothetical protein